MIGKRGAALPALLSLLLAAGLVPGAVPASAAPSTALFRLVASDASGVTIEYTAPEPSIVAQDTPFGRFDEIRLDEHSPLMVLGGPALPCRAIGIAVPDDAAPRLRFDVLESTELPGLRPLPCSEGSGPDPSGIVRRDGMALDPSIYDGAAAWPSTRIAYEETGRLRHHRIGRVVVNPMQFRPGMGVSFIRRARIRVDFAVAPDKRGAAPAGRGIDRAPVAGEPAWEDTYRNLCLNYEAARLFRSKDVPDLRPAGSGSSGGPQAAPPEHTQFRVLVGKTGIYYASYTDLAGLGWPAGVPLDQVRVFDYDRATSSPANPAARAVPFQVEEGTTGTAGTFDGDDVLYFYGLSFMDRYNPQPQDARYTRLHAYWITWGSGPRAVMSEVPGWYDAASFATPDRFVQRDRYEEDHYYLYYPPEPGVATFPRNSTLYWLGPFDDAEVELPFATPSREPADPIRIRARWQGLFFASHYIKLFLSRGASGNDDLPLGDFQFQGLGQGNHVFDSGLTVAGDRIADGTNRIRIVGNGAAGGDPTSPGSGSLLDWFEVTWSRHYVAQGGRLRFTTGASRGDVEFSIRGLPTGLPYVFDVTDSLAPRRVDLTNATFGRIPGSTPPEFQLRFRASAAVQRTYALYAPSALESMKSAVPPGFLPPDLGTTNVVADTYTDVREDNGADMLVLAHPAFQAALEPWLALRRSEGHTILVVSPQDVWDQFSGGDKSVPAIREWLRYVYRNWRKAPDHLVLVGDANEDYRHDTGLSDTDWVPTMMLFGPITGTETVPELVASDNWYVGSLGRLDSEFDVLPDMHVGRLPVGSPEEAEAVVAKLVAYGQGGDGDGWRNRALIVSDDKYSQPATQAGNYCYSPATDFLFERGGDSLQTLLGGASCLGDFSVDHFRLASLLDPVPGLGRHFTPNDCPDRDVARAYVAQNVRPLWLSAASQGQLVQFYSGHGNHTVMANEFLVEFNGKFVVPENRTVDQLTNYGKPFVFVGLACHLNQYELYEEKTYLAAIAERMVLLPGRGAIASIASTGFEVVGTNLVCEVALGKSLLMDLPLGPDGRPRRLLGEGFDLGMVRVATENPGEFFTGTLVTYCLLGDPSLRLDMAPPRLDVRVNDAPVQTGATIVSAPGGSTVPVTALLGDDVDYGGVTILNDGTAVPAEDFTLTPVETPGGCRAEQLAWTAPLKAATYDIRLTGTDWNGRETAFLLRVALAVEFRLNGRTLSPGQTIPPDATVQVIAHSPVPLSAGELNVTVNGETGFFDFAPTDAEGRVWEGVSHGSLPIGSTRLLATVGGAPARAEGADVTVSVQGTLAVNDVYFYPNPAHGGESSGFTYLLSYASGNEPRNVNVTVYSVSGRKVVSLDGGRDVGPNWLAWNLKDEEGDDIANGVYLYKMTIEGGNGSVITRTDRLVILK